MPFEPRPRVADAAYLALRKAEKQDNSRGTLRAFVCVMAGIRDHHDMIAWQLADELRRRVFDATETGRASTDFDFKGEIRDASSSVCRNLSEGFYRFSHRDGARMTTIARASLGETMDLVDEAEGRRYFSAELCGELRTLGKRVGAAIAGWLRHLLTTPDHPGLTRRRARKSTLGT